MPETMFIRLHEYNDWEGERWNWWLQLDGNEEQIDRLAWKLRDVWEVTGMDLPYTLHARDIEPESVVDKLVEYSDDGYNPSDNKVTGKFICPDDLGEDAENLYKGGITDYFHEVEEPSSFEAHGVNGYEL